MYERFEKLLQKYNLLDVDKKILLAVSGGVDSMLLFYLFTQLPIEKRPQLHIAHINHQLRPEADEEERFVQELASKKNVPFYSYIWEEQLHPESGIEVAARKMRYQFFKDIMKEHDIATLMTGHHQDDQVETVLMRLARGSSLKQLRGIQESQAFSEGSQLIRPLLSFSKEEIYAYAEKNKIPFMEDESNQESIYTRNRFRQEIIPLLKNENPRFSAHIEQFISDITDLLEISEGPIERAVGEAVVAEGKSIRVDLDVFNYLKPSLQRAVITYVLKKIYQDKSESYKTSYIELIRLWLLEGEVNTHLDLQRDYRVKKTYCMARFFKPKSHPVIVEDVVHLIEEVGEWQELSPTERIGLFPVIDGEGWAIDDNQLLIEVDKLNMPLRVRHRQPGDRMSYEGLAGTKKIKDIFIDEKTPIDLRNQAWIVEDAGGEIIWLISYRKLGLFTASETDKLVYVLKYEKD